MANGKIDKAIQQLFKQSVKLVKLWENASPTSAFPAQTIPLDLQAYDFALILKRPKSDESGSLMFCVSDNGTFTLEGLGHLLDNQPVAFFGRQAKTTKTGVSFGGSSWKTVSGSANANNNYLVPQKIYGAKLIGGGYNPALKIRYFLCRRGCPAW